jgi:hypothetical protein
MTQASQDRFREYERTRRHSMAGFGFRGLPQLLAVDPVRKGPTYYAVYDFVWQPRARLETG